MSVGSIYCGSTRDMLANRSNSDVLGFILCVLDLRGFASNVVGVMLGLEWVILFCFGGGFFLVCLAFFVCFCGFF